MKSYLSKSGFIVCLIILLGCINFPGYGAIPQDLEIIATAGGRVPGSEITYLQILANGQVTYILYLPDAIDQPYLEESSFTLNSSQLQQIWQAIQSNNFFSLNTEYENPSIYDRTFARLTVVANGDTHSVVTRNIAVQGFDNIIQEINNVTPEGKDLEYDTSDPPTIVPTDVCERQVPKKANSHSHKPLQSFEYYKKEKLDSFDSYDQCPFSFSEKKIIPHSGTAVGYRMSLLEAIIRGIVKFESKGGMYGDQMSITIDNTKNEKTNELVVKLYLEFWGSYATAENVAKIKNAIEGYWSGKMTSTGQYIMVEVITRRDQNATSAPGTPGYHQIELVRDINKSCVYGSEEDFGINHGVGSGKWGTEGKRDLNAAWAHEAGHLLSFDDQYINYTKKAPGRWTTSTANVVTTYGEAALAQTLAPDYPNLNSNQLEALLKKKKVGTVLSGSKPGHEKDIMAVLSGDVLKAHADKLANSKPGIIVEIPAGSLLMNKNGKDQNVATTRTIEMFVAAGQKKTLKGLYIACVDLSGGIPESDQGFDLAPHISTWTDNRAAFYLNKLLTYVDANDRYCDFDVVTQEAIWRITDNNFIGNPMVESFLAEADITLGDTMLNFPRLSNPDSSVSTSGFILPPELFSITISPSTLITSIGENVILSSSISLPELEDVSTTLSWSLEVPEGSQVNLSDTHNVNLSFVPDARGYYIAHLNTEITIIDSTLSKIESIIPIVTADEKTETFEDMFRENTTPFYWKTYGDKKWLMSGHAHTGQFSVESPLLGTNQTSTLEKTLSLTEAGKIAFAFKIFYSGYSLTTFSFSVDSNTMGEWSGETDWSRVSYNLESGHHTLRWIVNVTYASYGISDFVSLDDIFFPNEDTGTSLSIESQHPEIFCLYQNYPNPFNSSTTIRYDIANKEKVKLIIYDIKGSEVMTLVNKMQQPGRYSVSFNTSDLPSGLYIYQIKAGHYCEKKKMLVLK